MSPVAAVIAREIELVSRFVAVLLQEQEILKAGQTMQLPALGDEKNQLTAQINALDAQRAELTGCATGDRVAMENWLAAHPGDRDATVNWKNLLKSAGEAKTLHQLNSSLVDLYLRQTTEALAILTQKQEHSTLYGASGQSLPSSGSRIVDSA